jgi:hypothetical protein
MVFFKIILVGAAIAVLMAVARQEHWGQRAGLTGTCWAIQPPAGQLPGNWYACKQGILTSFPSLEGAGGGCSSTGLIAHDEIWSCTDPIVSMPGY